MPLRTLQEKTRRGANLASRSQIRTSSKKKKPLRIQRDSQLSRSLQQFSTVIFAWGVATKRDAQEAPLLTSPLTTSSTSWAWTLASTGSLARVRTLTRTESKPSPLPVLFLKLGLSEFGESAIARIFRHWVITMQALIRERRPRFQNQQREGKLQLHLKISRKRRKTFTNRCLTK